MGTVMDIEHRMSETISSLHGPSSEVYGIENTAVADTLVRSTLCLRYFSTSLPPLPLSSGQPHGNLICLDLSPLDSSCHRTRVLNGLQL